MLNEHIKNNKLKVLVKPNSLSTEIIGYDKDKNLVLISISSPAENNEANKELIKFVSKTLKKRVLIKSGLTSKEKVLVIED